MDYFVNVEHSPYQQWQAELLIESFKQHELDENLVVGLSLTSLQNKAEFCRNLYSHPRTHSVPNIGESRGFERLNWLYSMSSMLRLGNLKQPFVSIEPDCVLYKPVQIERHKDVPHIVFQVNPFFTLEAVEDNIPTITKHLPSREWVPLGGVMYFNNIPQGFFDRAIYLTELLAYEQAKEGRPIWRYTDRVAWGINMMEMVGRSILEGQYGFEMNLMDHNVENNFISYERGAPPHFSKSMFNYSSPAMLSFGDPFDVLSLLTDQVGTTSAHYLSDLAKKCIAARKVGA